ncbi:MAG TPA: DUF1292 domain-containing protein [Acholeplasmataceae bacterium]|nr:DUF1292 domain-containing protein [Acholeplasmataceae bacterium]
MENEDRLIYIDEDGNEVLCEILFTYESEKFKKNYVLFYPVGDEEDDEEFEVMAASYEPQEDGSVGQLMEIESDEEWEMLQEVFDTFMETEYDDEYDEDDDFDDFDDE